MVIRSTNAAVAASPASPLLRLLHLWGVVPGIAAPHRCVRLPTRDGVALAGMYLPGPAQGSAAAVLLLPGLAATATKPRYAYLAEELAREVAVLAVDPRGHGRSAGRSTLGATEVHDVRAGVAWLRARGHRWVGVLGFSMGAAAALRAIAAAPPGFADAVCAVSAPAVWRPATTPGLAVLDVLAGTPAGRAAARMLMRVRVAPRWPAPPPPLAVVARVAPTPLLVVHGTDDHLFGPHQGALLAARASAPVTLWQETPFGHAEDGLTPPFVRRLRVALEQVRRTGRWPAVPPGYAPPRTSSTSKLPASTSPPGVVATTR